MSPEAIGLDRYCTAYGLDPAEILGIDDPFIAHDLREALRVRGVSEARRKPAKPGELTVEDLMEMARREGGLPQ